MLKRYLFVGLLAVLCVTFFTRKDIRSVKEIDPELLHEPLQQKITVQEPIIFDAQGYHYELSPLYDYQISGLIVSKINYKLFSIYKHDSIFPVDLCLIWGSNLSRGLHRSSALSFNQDCRWCWVNWRHDLGFSMNEFSNNHLLVNSPVIERIVAGLLAGDQITISGKLVNVEARLTGKKDDLSPASITWKTSQERSDSGAGACEVIYVQDIKVLRRGNNVLRWLYGISGWGLMALISWNVFDFFFRKD